MRNIFFALAFVFLMAGCGGAGGGGQYPNEDPMDNPAPSPETEEPEMGGEPETPDDSETESCYKTEQETLIEFLNDVLKDGLQCGGNDIKRWEEKPTLKVAEGTTEKEKNFVRVAVNKIKRVLPDDQYNIDFREDEEVESLATKPQSGEITIDFTLPENLWCEDNCPIGRTRIRGTSEIESAQIRIRSQETVGTLSECDEKYQLIVSHEILHAFGLICHANHSRYHIPSVESIMVPGQHLPRCGNPVLAEVDVLTDLDRDALRAIYMLENGSSPTELQIDPDQECP